MMMINRDGKQKSIWQSSVEEYQPVNRLDESQQYDVIICGGGIAGITTALQLQMAGKKCLLLEAATICFGTTGGTTAHINTLLDNSYANISKDFGEDAARQVLEGTRYAITSIKKNISEFNIDCDYQDADAYLFSLDENQDAALKEIASHCNKAGLKAEFCDNIPLPIPFVSAIRVKEQAKFNPVKYTYGLAKAFEQAGGVILQHCRVKGLDELEQEVSVQTSAGTFTSAFVVVCTHIPFGVNLIHLRCIPYRSYAMAVALPTGAETSALCYDLAAPYRYYRTQKINGKDYFIVGGFDHKTGHEENCEQCFSQLEAHVAQHFDYKNVSFKWSSQYYEPADGLPYIGQMPGQGARVLVTTGFGGNGITLSQVAARVTRNILLNQDDPLIKLFNPNRIKPVAGFKNFISHNADMLRQFANKFFSAEQLEQWSQLAPGEAGLYKWDSEKIAVFKDEDGGLHAVDPNCTHFNCSVKWNNAEQSWDCPCHGARFSADGEVLNGPASVSLEKIELKQLMSEK